MESQITHLGVGFYTYGEAARIIGIAPAKLRRWARENYVPQTQRNGTWHPVVHDEMTRKDSESPVTSLAS